MNVCLFVLPEYIHVFDITASYYIVSGCQPIAQLPSRRAICCNATAYLIHFKLLSTRAEMYILRKKDAGKGKEKNK
jgi:hypothetical protein